MAAIACNANASVLYIHLLKTLFYSVSFIRESFKSFARPLKVLSHLLPFYYGRVLSQVFPFYYVRLLSNLLYGTVLSHLLRYNI